MPSTRRILHLDLDAFFCSVEILRDPSLNGKPFAVGGPSEQRGVIASCSYEARKCGVHSAMPTARAKKLCPALLLLRPDFKAYEQASQAVMAFLFSKTPAVEQISIDEAFVDISDFKEPSQDLAREFQQHLREHLHLPCSIGIAGNKLTAKIATTISKERSTAPGCPMGICVVPDGSEAAFLAPLPVGKLWGVGTKTEQRLGALGCRTIGALAAASPDGLVHEFGQHALDLIAHAQGKDDRPVQCGHAAKSIGQERTFPVDLTAKEHLLGILQDLTGKVGNSLRAAGFQGALLKVKLRYADFKTVSCQRHLSTPTDNDRELYQLAKTLFLETWQAPAPLRLLGVSVSEFDRQQAQLSLWPAAGNKQQRQLQQTLDQVRAKFGPKAVRSGLVLSATAVRDGKNNGK